MTSYPLTFFSAILPPHDQFSSLCKEKELPQPTYIEVKNTQPKKILRDTDSRTWTSLSHPTRLQQAPPRPSVSARRDSFLAESRRKPRDDLIKVPSKPAFSPIPRPLPTNGRGRRQNPFQQFPAAAQTDTTRHGRSGSPFAGETSLPPRSPRKTGLGLISSFSRLRSTSRCLPPI